MLTLELRQIRDDMVERSVTDQGMERGGSAGQRVSGGVFYGIFLRWTWLV